MNEVERQNIIVKTLKDHPFSTVKDLMALVGASAATIRRDILKLNASGAVRKVYGGIASMDANASMDRLYARPFEESRTLAMAEKNAIADEAVRHCRDGDTLIISGGTTCSLLASRLTHRSLKIYTNSMPVASVLGSQGIGQLVLAGGELHRESGIIFSTEPDPTPFYASRCFMGAQGIGPDGVMESHPMLVQSVRRLVDVSDEVVILADSRKFSIRARKVAVPFTRIAMLITDDQVADTDVRMLQEEGIEVVIAARSPV